MPVIRADQPGTVCCTEGSAAEILAALQGGTRTVELELDRRPGVVHGGRRRGVRDQGAGGWQLRLAQRRPHHRRSRLHHLPRPHRRPDHQHPPHGRPRARRGDRARARRFSINDHVGERTAEKGFVPAGAIRDGKHVEEVGGGVSQFATTMFNAAYFAGLQIDESQAHSEYFDRYPRGREATMGFPAPDLRFTNDTPYGIMIWTSYTQSSLTITLYSTPHARGEQTAITRVAVGQLHGRHHHPHDHLPGRHDQVGQVPRDLPSRRGPALLDRRRAGIVTHRRRRRGGRRARRRGRRDHPRPAGAATWWSSTGPRSRGTRSAATASPPARCACSRTSASTRPPSRRGSRSTTSSSGPRPATRSRSRCPVAPACTRSSPGAPSSTPPSSTWPGRPAPRCTTATRAPAPRSATTASCSRSRGSAPSRARYAIAADGMWSPMRKHLGVAMPGYRGEWHAFRQYFTDVGPRASEELFVWFEPDLLPGYAWSFPLPDGRANVGFGIQRDGGKVARVQDMGPLWPRAAGPPAHRRRARPRRAPGVAAPRLADPGPGRRHRARRPAAPCSSATPPPPPTR